MKSFPVGFDTFGIMCNMISHWNTHTHTDIYVKVEIYVFTHTARNWWYGGVAKDTGTPIHNIVIAHHVTANIPRYSLIQSKYNSDTNLLSVQITGYFAFSMDTTDIAQRH